MFAFRGSEKTLRAHALSVFFVFVLATFGFITTGVAESSLATPPSPNYCAPFAKTEVVRVARIYDGDTLTLSDGRKIRLVGINATELARDGRPGDPFSRRARQAVSEFVQQSRRMELLLDTETKDRYGRWLGHLYNDSGQSLEQHLLQRGLAYHVAIPPNLKLAECFATAEQRARDAKLGLWGDEGPLPLAAKAIRRGGFHRVRGVVTAVHLGKHWRLTLDDNISVMIYSEHHHRFTKAWFSHLLGQKLEVQGWIYKVKGQWRIKLETPYGVELL